MRINEYQNLAKRTLIEAPEVPPSDAEIMLIWNAVGLAGEAGELANILKKHVFHRHELDDLKVLDELGDVLWYLTSIATEMGFTLEHVMQFNVDKLTKRYEKGFTTQASKERKADG